MGPGWLGAGPEGGLGTAHQSASNGGFTNRGCRLADYYLLIGSQRGLVKGVLTGDPSEITQEKPFTPGKPPGFHPPDLRIR